MGTEERAKEERVQMEENVGREILGFLGHVLLSGVFIAGGMCLWCVVGVPFEREAGGGCMAGMASVFTSPIGGVVGLAVYLIHAVRKVSRQ
jgi:hypothetical protein